MVADPRGERRGRAGHGADHATTLVLRVVPAQDRPWAEIAADAGFHDQAHLTGELRRLMGVSPAAFRRGELPPATRCHAEGPGA
ncbi:AraC family transcriptional regulator [Lentzea sp. NPDC059081]|uniref:AraC family transcriptional regulator n=1 Tax=Lentzea sp. NPDC059081 TaxID=3346719 RepID=UPI00367CBB90